MKQVTVKPASKGVDITLDTGETVPAKGLKTALTGYIMRRVKDGDLIIVDSKNKNTSKSKETK